MPRPSDGNRSRVEIDVLLWLRPSFFSLQLPLSIFDSVPLCFSLLSSLSVLIPITPIRSTITLRFQWQRFISIFWSFLLGVKCSAIGLCERSSRWLFFLAEAASLDFSRRENSRRPHVDSASWPAQTMPLFYDRQIVRLTEKVRNCALQHCEIVPTSRMLRILPPSMWNRWRGIDLNAHSSDHLESSLQYCCFLHLIYGKYQTCNTMQVLSLVVDVFLCKYCCASSGSTFSLLLLSNRVDNKAYPCKVEADYVECNAITGLGWRDWLHLLLFLSRIIHGA